MYLVTAVYIYVYMYLSSKRENDGVLDTAVVNVRYDGMMQHFFLVFFLYIRSTPEKYDTGTSNHPSVHSLSPTQDEDRM